MGFMQGLTAPQLKQKLEGLGLVSKGKKAELLDMLNSHVPAAQVCNCTSTTACLLLVNSSQGGRCLHMMLTLFQIKSRPYLAVLMPI